MLKSCIVIEIHHVHNFHVSSLSEKDSKKSIKKNFLNGRYPQNCSCKFKYNGKHS